MQKSFSRFQTLAALIAACALLPAAAHAQSSASTRIARSDTDETRWYLGGSLGRAYSGADKSDYTDQRAGSTTSFTRNGNAGWKAYGGVQFTPNWALEVGYADLGRYRNDYSLAALAGSGQGNNRLSAWTMAGVGSWHLGSGFSVNGKAGLALVSNDYSFSGSGAGTGYALGDNGRVRDVNLMWGVGAKYDINKNFAVRFDYENYGKVGNATGNLTTTGATGVARPSLVSAGVQYTF